MKVMRMIFDIPSKIYMDRGAAREAGALLAEEGKKKALFICDKNLASLGSTGVVIESLKAAGIEVVSFDKVEGEPSYTLVEDAVAMARTEKVDAIIGMGGGSTLDTAKCTMIMAANGHILQYADTFEGIPQKGAFLMLIPTTFGTGSEVTNGAVISIPEEQRKVTGWGENAGANLAVIDPELALGIPSSVTASTGMDALAHAVEAYTSPMASYMSDMAALEAIKLILEYLPECVSDGYNIEKREKMCLGSLMAGIAFNNGGLNQSHELAHGLGAKFHVPHGIACALSLPLAIKANAEYIPDRISKLAELFDVVEGEDEGKMIIDRLITMRKELGIPGLKELGITENDFELVGDAWDAEPKGIYPFNPDRKYIIEYIRSIY